MKKIICSVMVTVLVMTGIGLYVINNITKEYEIKLNDESEKIAEIERELVRKESKLAEKENEITKLEAKQDDLETQVYNAFNGEDYLIMISHDGINYAYHYAAE